MTGQWLHGYQLYSFVDAGQVWNRGDETQKLASIGFGVRFNLWDELYAGIGYAVPIAQSSKTEEFTSSGRLLFSISKSFKFCPEREQMRCF